MADFSRCISAFVAATGGFMHVTEPGDRDAGNNAQHQYDDYQFDQRESASHPTSVYQLFSPAVVVFGHTSPVVAL